MSTCSFFQQPIWMNRYFVHKGKTIYFSSLIKSNILYVKDLFTDNGFKSLEEIGVDLLQKRNWLCEYKIVCNIFKRYEKLFNYGMCSFVNIKETTYFNFATQYDTFLNKKCNFFYHILLRKKFCSPCYKSYLSRRFNVNDKAHWEAIFTHNVQKTYDNDISEFNYKLLNNLLCSNLYLSKWKTDVNKFCKFCENEIENIEHLMYSCENVKEIWNLLGISLNIDLKWKHIIIGFYHEDNIKVKTLNNLISFTALKLYKFKMLCRIDNKQETVLNIRMNLKMKLLFWYNVLRYNRCNIHIDLIKSFYELL